MSQFLKMSTYMRQYCISCSSYAACWWRKSSYNLQVL